MNDLPLTVRKGKHGKILLLCGKDPELRGKIALARQTCVRWHIAILTDNFQHPHCIEYKVTNNRRYAQYLRTNTKIYSRCYSIIGYDGSFDLCIRWTRVHSPYPEISNMRIWAFGVDLGNLFFPKAPEPYRIVAHIDIHPDGTVFVNGRNTGIWEEFIGPKVPQP